MDRLRLVIPKGRLHDSVVRLLDDAGYGVAVADRALVPRAADPELEIKIMKPQNIPTLVELGSHHAGFTGLDWVRETGGGVEEVLDLGFDPVRVVAAVPEGTDPDDLTRRRIVAASEYERLAREYLDRRGFDYVLLRTHGATEAFPPDDADLIVDNVATGRTLTANKLVVLDTLLESTTRFVVNPKAMQDPWCRRKIEEMTMLFRSVLDARGRVMLEMNVPRSVFDRVVGFLPCMRSPTVAPLHGEEGFAVKVAVRRNEVAALIPRLKALGVTDILEYEFTKVVP